MTAMPTLLTPDDLLAHPELDHYELIDGIPREKDMGAEAEYAAGELQRHLGNHCHSHKLGRVFNSNTGYRCFPDRPKLVRKPDASVVRAGRLTDDRVPKGWITIPPDLAVEVISPTDRAEDIEERVKEYHSAGVPLVWVVNPSTRTAVVRRLDGTAAEVGPAGTLAGEDVVPGFACPVADLFV